MSKCYIIEKNIGGKWITHDYTPYNTKAYGVAYNYTKDTGIATRIIERCFINGGRISDRIYQIINAVI